MWLIFALGSAFFAGITAILAKCGIQTTDSDVATAIRTSVVLLFAWIMVFISGSASTIMSLDLKTWIFLILSGLSTGASWLCYFKALQHGDVNKVVPIDKSSTVLTILLAFLLLGEKITFVKICAVILIGLGTLLMIDKNKTNNQNTKGNSWALYAMLSALFASFSSIFGKFGIDGVESNLGTAIRTCVVLIMAFAIVFIKKKQHAVSHIPKNELKFICLSGIATGISWLCYYKALQDGPASVVVPIDKLSILVSVIFSYIVLKEKMSQRALLGLLLLIIGTLAMLIKTPL